MVEAGYNPYEAIKFWENMRSLSGGQKVSKLLSTHPPSLDRIKELKRLIPVMLKKEK
jgi:predicted Zn-dependent protease